MKKILILTAGFGDGHNAAARSLRDADRIAGRRRARGGARPLRRQLRRVQHPRPQNLSRRGAIRAQPLGRHLLAARQIAARRKTARQFHAPARARSKKSWPRPSRIASSPPIRSMATSSRRFIATITSGRSGSSPSSRIPSRSTPRGSARRAIVSAWPTTPPPRCCARAASPEEQIKVLGFPVNPVFAEQPVGTSPARRRRTAPRPLHHQHRQEKGRQGD